MLVFIPGVCAQLLDIGSMHEPCCHITTVAELATDTDQLCLAPLYKFGKHSVLNVTNLDILNVHISTSVLVKTFKSDTSIQNKLSILHYLLLHLGEMDIAGELVSSLAEKMISLDFPRILKEYLIGGTFALVQRNLPFDAHQLINLLPLTTQPAGNDEEVQINDKQICLSQDVLWNASMMLLSPQQRIVPYRSDIWVKLWDHLSRFSKSHQKFKPSQVVEKLLVSLVCYQVKY